MRRATLLVCALLMAGCGDDSSSTGKAAAPPAAAATPEKALDPKLVAGLGDSITAGSPLWDPVPEVREQFAARVGAQPDERSQWGFWFERENPGVRVRNCGVFGERTDEIAARLEACTEGAGVVVVQGGINDIAQGRAIEDAAKDLDAMVVRAQESDRRVLMVEVLPWNNGYPAAAPQIDDLNRSIRAIGKRRGVRVLPWFRALDDPRARGRMRRDLTIDGDHPSVAGYRKLAALVELP